MAPPVKLQADVLRRAWSSLRRGLATIREEGFAVAVRFTPRTRILPVQPNRKVPMHGVLFCGRSDGAQIDGAGV